MGQENGDYVILYTGQIKIISHVNGPRKLSFSYVLERDTFCFVDIKYKRGAREMGS